MSVYVGLKQGKIHECKERSEYYCGGCGYPVTDHDSYCRECGGAFQESFATERWGGSRWHELFGKPQMTVETILNLKQRREIRKLERDAIGKLRELMRADRLTELVGHTPMMDKRYNLMRQIREIMARIEELEGAGR